MANTELRRVAQENGIRLWELAEVFGVNDSNFSRKLRREFSDADRERALEAIAAIRESREGIQNG